MKKYIVRLGDEERKTREGTIDRLKGGSSKSKRARILLQANADGPGWKDRQTSVGCRCTVQPVENMCKRCVPEGVELALNGKSRPSLPVPRKLLDSEQEAQVIALRLSPPPCGYANWSLRLLARRVVELAIVESISHEIVRRTLRKTASRAARCSTG